MRFNRADFVFNHVEHVEHVGVWGGAPTLPVPTCSTWFKNFPALRGLAAAFILLCSLSASALPLAWRADWPDCKPVEKLVHRGTDVELQPAWYIYGTPAASTNWTLTTYVQTNCVGQWFGPLPGAFFSHTNDVGAASYGVMVRAQAPDGSVNYTAFARLRMLDSPGYTPGALPLPVPILDFADVSVRNPPWPSAIASATNTLDQYVSSRLSSATNTLDQSWSSRLSSATNTLDQSWSSRLSQTSRDATNYTDSATTLTPMLSDWAIDPPEYNGQPLGVWWDGSVPIANWWITLSGSVIRCLPIYGEGTEGMLHWSAGDSELGVEVTATRSLVGYILGSQPNKVLAPTNNLVKTQTLTNYYTRAETDDAIDALAAYYITANAAGDAFPSVAALTNATAYYSGGALRTPTRNDYAVVLADESHGGAEWRYIYAVHEGATTGQWEPQYPIETNDYEALANKPQINGVELSGNKSAADLGLATPQDVASATNTLDQSWSARLSQVSRSSTNYTDYAISTADTSYPRFTTATNLNQSVQYLTSAPGNVLTIELPTGSAATKDWIVYAYFGAETALALPAANWWMADESYTNAIPASTPTAFYFSQVSSNIFTISRQELKTITITNE